MINTQKISVDTAVKIILESSRSPEIQEGGRRAEEKLLDIALKQKAEAALLGILGVEGRHVNLQVEKGDVILRGAIGSAEEKEKCQRALAGLEGVRRVDNQLLVTEHYRFGG